MGWEDIDNKLKRKIDSFFVSCEERYELEYLKKLILEEFSYFDELKVEQALKVCCKRVNPPRLRREYLKCLQNVLGGEW